MVFVDNTFRKEKCKRSMKKLYLFSARAGVIAIFLGTDQKHSKACFTLGLGLLMFILIYSKFTSGVLLGTDHYSGGGWGVA